MGLNVTSPLIYCNKRGPDISIQSLYKKCKIIAQFISTESLDGSYLGHLKICTLTVFGAVRKFERLLFWNQGI